MPRCFPFLTQSALVVGFFLGSHAAFAAEYPALYGGMVLHQGDALFCKDDPTVRAVLKKVGNDAILEFTGKDKKAVALVKSGKSQYEVDIDNDRVDTEWAYTKDSFSLTMQKDGKLILSVSAHLDDEVGNERQVGDQSVWSVDSGKPDDGTVPGLILDLNGSLIIRDIKVSDQNAGGIQGRERWRLDRKN